MKKRINKDYKKVLGVLGIIIGGLLFSGMGYAAGILSASDIPYSNTKSGISSTNVQGAVDELYLKAKNSNGCPSGYTASENTTVKKVCTISSDFKDYVKIGDYIKMTPTSTSYTPPTTNTGYSTQNTINPSELNIWRVIRKNSDGTIDMVSQNVSSKDIYFSDTTGYYNYVGVLNTIANQYKNTNYTVAARAVGYNGQTSTLSSINYTSSGSVSESLGGGDTLYTTDTNLIQSAIGTLASNGEYYVASRYREYESYPSYYRVNFKYRYINTSGSIGLSFICYYDSYYGRFQEDVAARKFRPIVTLKSGISPSTGSGTSSSPYVFS